MKVDELNTRYLAENPAIKSEHTRRLFRIVVRHFERFRGGEALVADLNDAVLNQYAESRRQNMIAESTIENEVVRLRSLWNFAAKEKMCEPPKWKLNRLRPNKPTAMTPAEVRTLFQAAEAISGMMAGRPRSVYFTALLWVLWDTGERIGAVLELDRNDIEPGCKHITVRKRKGCGRTLRWPLRRESQKALQRFLDMVPDAKPFAILKRSKLYRHWNIMLREAGIESSPRYLPHGLRRAVATHYQASGGDASRILDHSDSSVTSTYYIDASQVSVDSPSKRLFNPLSTLQRMKAAAAAVAAFIGLSR